MMPELATAFVVFVTAATSLWAFNRPDLLERWIFDPKAILADKEYWRVLTSGFIHADWMHFAFNMFSLVSFGTAIESTEGPATFLLVYFTAILGGSLLALFIHRHHDYRALGASGGVCGVIYACIFLVPGSSVSMFLMPFSIPAWLYAVGYLVVSFVSLRRGSDNIGHDAHLGGAMAGLLAATALHPWIVAESPRMYAGVMGVSAVILLVTWLDPMHLLEERCVHRRQPQGSKRYQRYDENRERVRKMAEMDRLLDKVSANGIHALSKADRATLERLSKEIG
jgi:membrane associated rhomboid family serine protease